DVRPRCSASRHTGVSPLTATLVQTTAKRVQRPPEFGVAGSQTHGAFELAQRVPPPPLFYMDPREIHVGELPRLVALGLLCPLEAGHGLVEVALLHQATAKVRVRLSDVTM